MSEYLLSLALLFADYGQTRDILNSNGRFAEGNAIIHRVGATPYFAGIAMVNTAIYAVIPSEYSNIYFRGFNIIQLSVVGNNALVGVGFEY